MQGINSYSTINVDEVDEPITDVVLFTPRHSGCKRRSSLQQEQRDESPCEYGFSTPRSSIDDIRDDAESLPANKRRKTRNMARRSYLTSPPPLLPKSSWATLEEQRTICHDFDNSLSFNDDEISFLALPDLLPTMSANSLITTPSSNRVSPVSSPTSTLRPRLTKSSSQSTIFTTKMLRPRKTIRATCSELGLQGRRLFDEEDGASSFNRRRREEQQQPPQLIVDEEDDDDRLQSIRRNFEFTSIAVRKACGSECTDSRRQRQFINDRSLNIDLSLPTTTTSFLLSELGTPSTPAA